MGKIRRENMDKKVVLITGVSSGIGLELAKKFIKSGWKVYGVSRKEFSLDGLFHIICDVSSLEQFSCVKALCLSFEKAKAELLTFRLLQASSIFLSKVSIPQQKHLLTQFLLQCAPKQSHMALK